MENRYLLFAVIFGALGVLMYLGLPVLTIAMQVTNMTLLRIYGFVAVASCILSMLFCLVTALVMVDAKPKH